jgi:hypothetical protein
MVDWWFYGKKKSAPMIFNLTMWCFLYFTPYRSLASPHGDVGIFDLGATLKMMVRDMFNNMADISTIGLVIHKGGNSFLFLVELYYICCLQYVVMLWMITS